MIAATTASTTTLTARNVLLLGRNPNSVVSAVVAPVVFLLGFSAVMSRTMEAQGIDYAQFLPPAIVAQAMFFTAISSGFFLAADVQSGVLRRLRTLPIPGVSVVLARAGADALRGALSLAVVVLTAWALGFRFEAGAASAIGFVAVAVVFALVMAAGCGAVGLAKGDPEQTSALLIMPYLPLLMLSTGFVPLASFPGWLQPFVEWSPVSAVIDSLRALSSGGALADPLWRTTVWMVLLAGLFGLAGVRALRRSA